MAYQAILYQKADKIARITLNRPEKLNAISRQLQEEVGQAISEANQDSGVRVIILKGAGRAFCAGYDITPRPLGPEPPAYNPVNDYLDRKATADVWMTIWRGPKPVVAQVHGWCLAGGTDLVLCCDIILAAEDAQFAYPMARIWGTPITNMWPYLVGLQWAKRLMLTGDHIDGKTAERIGLIYKAVPAEELETEVESLAARMSNIPLGLLASNKLLINSAYEAMGLETTQFIGSMLDGIVRHTPEGMDWWKMAREQGLKAALDWRDAPFGDYRAAKKD